MNTNRLTTEPGTYAVEIAEVRRSSAGRWLARLVRVADGLTLCWDELHAVRDGRAAQAMVGVRGTARLVRAEIRMPSYTRECLRVAEWEVAP